MAHLYLFTRVSWETRKLRHVTFAIYTQRLSLWMASQSGSAIAVHSACCCAWGRTCFSMYRSEGQVCFSTVSALRGGSELRDQANMPQGLATMHIHPLVCSSTHQQVVGYCMQEMDGIRNSHIDKFLPPKRNPEKGGRRELSFVFDPIVDLNLPDRDQ